MNIENEAVCYTDPNKHPMAGCCTSYCRLLDNKHQLSLLVSDQLGSRRYLNTRRQSNRVRLWNGEKTYCAHCIQISKSKCLKYLLSLCTSYLSWVLVSSNFFTLLRGENTRTFHWIKKSERRNTFLLSENNKFLIHQWIIRQDFILFEIKNGNNFSFAIKIHWFITLLKLNLYPTDWLKIWYIFAIICNQSIKFHYLNSQ